MKKSVYSLVLSDDLVQAVDALAYQKHTSRSNLINQILAEHLSLSTPEMRMKSILSYLERRISTSDSFQVALPATDSQIFLRTALRYKYNPTVQYSIVLYRSAEHTFGELRVSFRTQNQSLLSQLTAFFRLWARIENTYISQLFPDQRVACSITPGKFTRELLLPAQPMTENELADAAARYVSFFDSMLKLYFQEPADASARIASRYLNYLRGGATIL